MSSTYIQITLTHSSNYQYVCCSQPCLLCVVVMRFARVRHKESCQTTDWAWSIKPGYHQNPTPLLLAGDVQWFTSAAAGHSILKVRCYFTTCDASRMPAQHSEWNGICPVTTLQHVSSHPTLPYCERSNEVLVVRLVGLALLQAI